MRIKYPWCSPYLPEKAQTNVTRALRSGWLSDGPFVTSFETKLRSLLKTRFALSTSNGTSSLHLAYLALGLKKGDEILVPGFCFLAAANVALELGIKPVFADIDEKTWCLSPEAAARKITKRTKALIAVHTYGNVCDMSALKTLAKKYRLWLIEDTAEALFSSYKGKAAGTLADMGTFSFHASKTLTCGEGGLVVPRSRGLYETLALYRNHGFKTRGRYLHVVAGNNFRLTNLQAALGLSQADHAMTIIQQRRRVHREYKQWLGQQEGIALQEFSKEVDPVLWVLAVRLNPKVYRQGRDTLARQLKQAGIETRPGFLTPSQQALYHQPLGSLPVSERVGREILTLPTYPSLSSQAIRTICEILISLRTHHPKPRRRR